MVIALLILQIAIFAITQNPLTEFGVLIGTLTMIPVIVAAFAYAYLAIPHTEFDIDPKSGEPISICTAKHTSQCLYFSAVTFTTLGYGDIQPTGPARTYAISEAFLGFIFVPLLLAQLINFVRDFKAELNRNREENSKKLNDLLIDIKNAITEEKERIKEVVKESTEKLAVIPKAFKIALHGIKKLIREESRKTKKN